MAFSPAGLAKETVLFSEGKAESASQAAPGTASQTERYLRLRAVLATSARTSSRPVLQGTAAPRLWCPGPASADSSKRASLLP